EQWGHDLGTRLSDGCRLLVAGNGGSAAQAQHLTAEVVGRFEIERRALSALALNADTSILTALGNDIGYAEIFSRQVEAHGRPGDVLLLLSTSGRSANLLRAAESARKSGLTVWALIGSAGSPLAKVCDDCFVVGSQSVALAQEMHLVAMHALCRAIDDWFSLSGAAVPAGDLPRTSSAPLSEEPRFRIVVVGDLVQDETISGVVTRTSPDAPVQVVGSIESLRTPGGAGLAASFAQRDGHDVTLVTAVSGDPVGQLLLQELSRTGVQVVNLGTAASTPTKTRIRARDQTILMLDDAGAMDAIGALSAKARAVIDAADGILVADYGRGLTLQQDVRSAIGNRVGQIPVVWDPHERGGPPVQGTTVVTPNVREAQNDRTEPYGWELGAIVRRAQELRTEWDVASVAVTGGSHGAVLIMGDGESALVVPTREVRGDAVGAGDRFSSSLIGSLASGALPSKAVPKAVLDATAYVARINEVPDHTRLGNVGRGEALELAEPAPK
ncbi:UNVERIFIED_CONTAM: hypothetical protein GTU68_064635, partial [Idotea baltica]|nr:hypothetical protein [Idotea baltica]